MFSKKLVVNRIIFGLLFLGLFVFSAQNSFASSTISGTIYDKQRNTLSDVDVELLNDFYQQVKRTRTDGSGRYQFDGLNDGRFTVRVMAFRFDLEDQSQSVEINTLNIQGTQGTSFQLLDFYMFPRKGGLADSELGVVFAQNIPAEAKKTYEKALSDLSGKRTNDGIMGLNKAVGLFPDYYLALHRLGKELFVLKKYPEAAQFFFKAAQVNPKSATSFYYLGYSLYNMNKNKGKEYNKAALAALNESNKLAPASAQVLYILGKIERADGNFESAEKHLLEAKKVSKVTVPEIHKELAQLYSNDMKKYNEAADELEIFLKNNKPSENEKKEMKKVISDLREKAKSQSSN
jgi:tetratricopeptide (TPR) repeat protein